MNPLLYPKRLIEGDYPLTVFFGQKTVTSR